MPEKSHPICMLSSSVCDLRTLHFTGELVGLTYIFVWSDNIWLPYLVQYRQVSRLSLWWVFVPWSVEPGLGSWMAQVHTLAHHTRARRCLSVTKMPFAFQHLELGPQVAALLGYHGDWMSWYFNTWEMLTMGSEYSVYLCAYPHPCPGRPLKVEGTPYTLVSSTQSMTRDTVGAHWGAMSPSWKATNLLHLSRANFSRQGASPFFISASTHSTQWRDFTTMEVR